MQTTDEHDDSQVEKAADAQRTEEREEQFRTLAENIPGVATYLDRLIVDDPGHSIPLYISPQVEQMLGYPLAEWLDESELWLRILHPEDRDRLVAADANARKHLQALSEEYRLLHRDGHVVWVSEKSAVVPDVSTGTLYWQGVMVDITDRKHAETALQERAGLLDLTHDTVFVRDMAESRTDIAVVMVSDTSPSWVNLKAFDSRFLRICCKRLLSVTSADPRLRATKASSRSRT